MERAMGIEPTSEAWEASILPLYDARSFLSFVDYTQPSECRYSAAETHTFPLGETQGFSTPDASLVPTFLLLLLLIFHVICVAQARDWKGVSGESHQTA